MEGRIDHKYVVLNGKNWPAWKFQMSVILKSKKLYGVVTGGETASENDLEKWQDRDNKAQEIIVTRLDEKIMSYISSCTTSRQMWEKLITLYEPSSQVSVHLVQQRFFSLTFEEPIMMFISKLEEITNQLRTMGEVPSDRMIVTKTLMSLPEKYCHFVSAWESVPESQQNMKELTSRLLIEEERSAQHELNPTTSAFMSRSKPTGSAADDISARKCFVCGKVGHYKRDCKQRKCFRCKKMGHLAAVCNQIKCYQCNQMGHLAKDCSTSIDNKDKVCKSAFVVQEPLCTNKNQLNFIMDSGASEHMTYNRKLLCNLRNIEKQVIIGDGKALNVEGIGDIHFLAYNGSDYVPSVMYNVLYVPSLHANLFSLTSAVDHGHTVLSGEKQCKFINKGHVVALAKRLGSLYIMDFKIESNFENNSNGSAIALVSLSIWHERLAHQNFKHVKEILHKNNIKYEGQTDQCTSCILGKQHRLPFPNSNSRAESPGELIHADLCGPMEVSSLGKSSYFLLLKDDYSNYRFVYFLKNKYETKDRIAEFLELVKNHHGYRVRRLRSDGGGEFINRDVEELFKHKGIVHDTTVAYTPEQNGRIEREMRTIVESARTMIINAGVSKEFWAEAVNNAVFTINRTGSSNQKGKTPYELFCKSTFDINILRIFGTEVYAHIPKQKRRKWDPKGKLGIFIGYGTTTKGYRVWFEDIGCVETHRDVIFVQTVRKEEEEIQQTVQKMEPESEEEEEEGNLVEEEEREEVPDEEIGIEERPETERSEGDAEIEEERVEEDWFSPEEEEGLENERTSRGRRVKKPAWMSDYEVGLVAQGEEELSYEEAVNGEDRNKWQKAIQRELEALKQNSTWKETNLPKGKKTIDSKWVFKIKKDGDNEIYKARLVARGFKQEDRLDHSEIYAPVAKLPTLRILLAIANKYCLDIQQMDVKSAFLYGRIEEEVYLEKPKGMKKDGMVLKLERSLYGLKKSPRYWNERFHMLMMQEGFIQSKCDYCLYFKKDIQFYVLLYVDDILLISRNSLEIEKMKEVLKKNFNMKDMNGVSKYLGINIRKKDDSIEIDQEDYLKDILKKYKMEDCKPVSTPMEPGMKIERSDKADEELTRRCRKLIGSLMYAMLGTRPDICYALSYLSRFQAYANEEVWKSLKRILRYIKGTLGLKLVYRKGSDEALIGYSDADWGGDQEGHRKSTSGYIMKVYGCTVSWSSNKQQCVALSSTEAEYVSLARGISEGCWIKHLLTEINLKCDKVVMFEDNQSAIHVAKNPENHKRLKHIDLKYHFIRDKVEKKIVLLKYIESEKQVADICTKPLCRLKFVDLRNNLF